MFSLQSRSSAGKMTKNIKKLICLLLTAIILMGSVALFPKEAKAAPFHATSDMLQGTAYAVLTDAGELIFFRSNNTYTAGAGQTVTDIKGNTYTGRVYTGVETTGSSNPPWYSQGTSVKSVRVLSQLDVSGFDTSNVTRMMSMFYNCRSLKKLDLSNFSTERCDEFSAMFEGCYSLEELDISGMIIADDASVNEMLFLCAGSPFQDWAGQTNLRKIVLGPGFKFLTDCYDDDDGYMGDAYFWEVPPANESYTGNWIREDGAYGPFSPDDFETMYEPYMAGTWVWEQVRTEYTLVFTADSAVGSMPPQALNVSEDGVISANTFKKFGYTFDHWDDGQGHEWADGATIPAGTYAAGDTVTLTAVFVPRNTTVNMEDGAFDLYLYGNETATFSGLPAGTNYQVYEETPDGWVLVSEENISGIIHPLETAEVKFVNRYQPGTTSVRFSGVKTLDGSAAPAGSFTFELLENDAVIQAKTVTDGGFVLFDEIVYTSADAGIHRYKIREVQTADEYDYDPHIEEITVTVVDNGDGTMSATTVYDQDGIRFINSTRPGSLRLTKRVTGQTDANENDEFTFKIKLTTPNGQVIDDDLYWYIDGQGQP